MKMENANNIYKHLTDEEWNAILKFIIDNKQGEVIDICMDENGDYFYDMEYDTVLPFEGGLDIMSADIYTDGVVFADYNYAFRHLIQSIFEKYSENEKLKNYIQNVNSTLDKNM